MQSPARGKGQGQRGAQSHGGALEGAQNWSKA